MKRFAFGICVLFVLALIGHNVHARTNDELSVLNRQIECVSMFSTLKIYENIQEQNEVDGKTIEEMYEKKNIRFSSLNLHIRAMVMDVQKAKEDLNDFEADVQKIMNDGAVDSDEVLKKSVQSLLARTHALKERVIAHEKFTKEFVKRVLLDQS